MRASAAASAADVLQAHMRSQAGLLQHKGLPFCAAVLCRRCELIRRDHRSFRAGIFWCAVTIRRMSRRACSDRHAWLVSSAQRRCTPPSRKWAGKVSVARRCNAASQDPLCEGVPCRIFSTLEVVVRCPVVYVACELVCECVEHPSTTAIYPHNLMQAFCLPQATTAFRRRMAT